MDGTSFRPYLGDVPEARSHNFRIFSKDMTMINTRLLQSACTVAMLAASPVFAQSNTPTGATGAGGAPNTPTMHEAMPGGTTATSTAGGDSAASTAHSRHMSMPRHHSAGMMHRGKGDTSQDAAVDQLNQQSYQAAQQGHSFSGTGSTGGATAAPSGAGMRDMNGGSTSGGGMSGGKM